MKTIILPLVLSLACLSGCAHVASSDSEPQLVDAQTAHRLYQRDWDLKGLAVEGHQVVIDVDTRITIRFAPNGQVGGIAAVNRFSGTYTLGADGKLGWGRFAVTRMMGPPELMEKEQAYLRGLAKANIAILAEHVLVLQSDDASTVLRFNEAGF